MNRGKVYLVGAGPGAADLITLKGLKCIQKADVIIYDRLINKDLLNHASPQAEIIYAGKSPGRHTLIQKRINELLVEKARQGRRVVRLKGGDPFIFGRGGEELGCLAENGIGFELVPGVTSVVGAPAYAGIPLTHRDYSSSVGIVTGHPVQKMSNISWESLVGLDTLIILMGVRNLPEIVNHLIEHKRSKDTPIAIIQDAALYTQKVLIGTLGDILQKARESEIRPPCIIIIGEVVKLRKKLDWFKKAPRERKVAAELRAGAKKEIRKNRPAVIAITERGLTLARKIQGLLGKADLFIPPALAAKGSDSVQVYQNSLKELVAGLFTTYRALIFIMACGIVVRVIAPYLKDKHTDPAVVVVDEGGNFSISLISGHEGGANDWAKKVASLIESRPVITTASELFPRPSVVVGIGCHQGVSRQEIKDAIFESLKKANFSLKDVRNLATIANRKNEKGLIEFSQRYGIPVETFSLNQLKEVPLFSEPSKYALDVLGVKGVCEPVAMLSAQCDTLIQKKRKWKNVTIAIAEVNSS